MKKFYALLAVLSTAAQGAVLVGDSARGTEVFKSQNCVTCHSVNGEGGKAGPDLGKRASRGYTPSELTSLMWNHAPAMWSAMEKANVAKPKLNSQQAADLFAYFYAARYFERKGDAGRGREAFAKGGCSECHAIGGGGGAAGPAVVKWESVADPIELCRQMWNHSGKMREAMKAKGMRQPQLTAAEMNDITVYLQNLPATRGLKPQFQPAAPGTGEMLFELKGCKGCHHDANALVKGPQFRAASDFAAGMWNHSAKMQQRAEIRPEEMKRLVGYLWALQFANEGANAARGAKVFEARGCGNCHGKGIAPVLALGERATSYEMIAVLWDHGPAMHKEMKAKGIAWPRFESTEMADLLAHLRGR
ncbi:MAG: c-type cytochrome [Candidatus Solibacter usitatus]|nr:c-type cytochrome [Candidatus Solibacter usitatus]